MRRADGSHGLAVPRLVWPGVVAAGLLAAVAVGAQASNLVLDPGRWDEVLAWLFGGGAVLSACSAAAWRVGGGQSRVGRAWWLWGAAAAFLVAGAAVVAGFELVGGSVPLLAYAPWLGFALLGVAGLAFRASPEGFAFPLFVLDACPAMLAAVAFIRTDGGSVGQKGVGWGLLSTVFPALFMLLALVAVEVVLAQRRRLVEDVSLAAAGFTVMALASVLWVSPVERGFAQGGWSDALWTAGALGVALGGGRAALGQNEVSEAQAGVEESAGRALLPVAGTTALVLMLIEQYGRFHLLVWVTLAALVLLAVRFFLARRATGLALERERDARVEIEQARRQLAEQNERLLELDRLKDSFVAAVSHELRTPLTSIRGYLELVREGEVGELTPEQEKFLAVVDRNADRLLRVVGDLLVIAQADSGRLALEVREVDLGELVADAVQAAGPSVEAKGIHLRHHLGTVPRLVGDPHRLGQVLDNLLSNAVKFTPTGGVVKVRTSVQGSRVLLEVADTGMGMSPDEQARLFERFYRAPAANKQAIPGTGLGLSIVKAIVEAHGGEITVQTHPGQGTTFRVALPLEHVAVGVAP